MADANFPKPSASEATSKIDKVVSATDGNFAMFTGGGNITDSGHKHGDYLTSHQDISGKVSGPVNATENNVAIFDGSTGKVIKDSGYTIAKSIPSNAVFTDTTYSFTNNGPTLSWNTTSTIGTVGGTALTVKLPANPNTNTTYSFTNNAPTLAWNTTSTIGTVGGVALTVKLPANPNTDHYAWSDITGKPSTYAPSSHTHAWSEITGKPNRAGSSSDGGAATSALTTPTVSASEVTSANPDTMYTTGLYQVKSLASGKTLPVEVWAALLVLNYLSNGTNSRVYQMCWHDAEGETPKQYFRTCYNGTWYSWKRIQITDGTGASGTWGINVTGYSKYLLADANSDAGIRSVGNISYGMYGGTTSDNEANRKLFMKYLCAHTSNSHIHVGSYNPNSKGPFIANIYDVNDVNSDGLPRYSTFFYDNLGSSWPCIFGTSSFSYYAYNLLTSGNYTEYCPTKTGSGASGTWGINVTGSAGSVAWSNVSGRPSIINNLTSTSTTDALSAKQGRVIALGLTGCTAITVGPNTYTTLPWGTATDQHAIAFWYHSSAALNPQAVWYNATVHIYNMSAVDLGTIAMSDGKFVNNTDYWLYVIIFKPANAYSL